MHLPVFLVFSRRLQERGGGGNMVLIVVEAVPASSKPPAGADVRISTGERRGSGDSAPSSTRALSLQIERYGGSMESSKVVQLVASSSTQADEISP